MENSNLAPATRRFHQTHPSPGKPRVYNISEGATIEESPSSSSEQKQNIPDEMPSVATAYRRMSLLRFCHLADSVSPPQEAIEEDQQAVGIAAAAFTSSDERTDEDLRMLEEKTESSPDDIPSPMIHFVDANPLLQIADTPTPPASAITPPQPAHLLGTTALKASTTSTRPPPSSDEMEIGLPAQPHDVQRELETGVSSAFSTSGAISDLSELTEEQQYGFAQPLEATGESPRFSDRFTRTGTTAEYFTPPAPTLSTASTTRVPSSSIISIGEAGEKSMEEAVAAHQRRALGIEEEIPSRQEGAQYDAQTGERRSSIQRLIAENLLTELNLNVRLPKGTTYDARRRSVSNMQAIYDELRSDSRSGIAPTDEKSVFSAVRRSSLVIPSTHAGATPVGLSAAGTGFPFTREAFKEYSKHRRFTVTQSSSRSSISLNDYDTRAGDARTNEKIEVLDSGVPLLLTSSEADDDYEQSSQFEISKETRERKRRDQMEEEDEKNESETSSGPFGDTSAEFKDVLFGKEIGVHGSGLGQLEESGTSSEFFTPPTPSEEPQQCEEQPERLQKIVCPLKEVQKKNQRYLDSGRVRRPGEFGNIISPVPCSECPSSQSES